MEKNKTKFERFVKKIKKISLVLNIIILQSAYISALYLCSIICTNENMIIITKFRLLIFS